MRPAFCATHPNNEYAGSCKLPRTGSAIIVALRRRDVVTRNGVTTIQLGPDALELGEPLAQIARELADGAVPDAWTGGIARAFPNVGERWLSPGRAREDRGASGFTQGVSVTRDPLPGRPQHRPAHARA